MLRESWRAATLVSAVQVLSECVFHAQGILASEEKSGEKELDWMLICTPIFFTATRHLSEPCWRWICGSYGGRLTTILGLTTIAVSAIAASCQEMHVGNLALVILGGIGMGLVRLQVKLMKLYSEEAKWPLWGAGVSGIGLSLWPLLACLFVLKLGSGYAILALGGITLHGLPLALLIQPKEEIICEENRTQNVENEAPVPMDPTFCDMALIHEKYPLAYKIVEYDSYRVRPSCFVEVLPGIPEESEYDSDCDLEHEIQLVTDVEAQENGVCVNTGFRDEECGQRKSFNWKKMKGKNIAGTCALKTASVKPVKPFVYTFFVASVLLRLGDQFGVAIVISLLPNFAERLLPSFRIQEKAFLMSICGFSRVLTELPLIVVCNSATKTKFVVLCGPFLACIGLYLTWISTNLDAMTLASFALGIGSGAASAALQILTTKECPGASEFADIVVGVGLLLMVPLTRVFISGDAIRGCFLVCAWIYAAAAIVSAFGMRRRT